MTSEPESPSAPRLRIARCAQCGQSTRLDPSNPWRPFCSERCKLVDLGAWFGERYRVAAEAPQDFDKGE